MYAKIKNAIKEAMKNKDSITRDCLKMVIDKARTIQKEKMPNNAPEIISDDILAQAVQREMKQLHQTIDALKGRENSDLYMQTSGKIAVLSGYLPSQMSKEEVERSVFNILTGGNYPDFGSKMRVVMAELKGKADNKIIKEAVEKYK
jgi:uncharacterized protein YqeY